MSLIHDSYFSLPLSEAVVSNHIKDAHETLYRDRRFEDVPEKLAATWSGMRFNGCAVLRLHFWFLHPGGPQEKVFPRLGYVVLKPIAALSDAVVNSLLLIVKVAGAVLLLLRKSLSKLWDFRNKVGVHDTLLYCERQLGCHLNALGSSVAYLAYQLAGGILLNFLGPRNDLYCRLSGSWNLAYWVQDEKRVIHPVVDRGRVTYLQTHCGWEGVDDAFFTSHAIPWINPWTIAFQEADLKSKLS